MNYKFYFLFLSISTSFTNCSQNDELNSKFICDNFQNIPYDMDAICAPKIMTYQFGLENLSPEIQVNTLYNLGMDGMILEIDRKKLPSLIDYYSTNKVVNKEFQIYDIFTILEIDKPNQIDVINAIYATTKCSGTRLQVIFKGNKNSPNLVATIASIASIAKSYDKTLIIYPHQGTAIETAEEAYQHIVSCAKDNVFLAVHLCHELAAGNGPRINEVVKNVSPFIKSVSISGANVSEKDNNSLPLWYWGIKPLNMGNYDYHEFINSLHSNQYKGPIAIHTWGIYENFGLKPIDYIPESKNILLDLCTTICD